MRIQEDEFKKIIEEFCKNGKKVMKYRSEIERIKALKNKMQKNNKGSSQITIQELTSIEKGYEQRILSCRKQAKKDFDFILNCLKGIKDKKERISLEISEDSIEVFLAIYYKAGDLAYVIKMKPGDPSQYIFISAYLLNDGEKLKNLYKISYLQYLL